MTRNDSETEASEEKGPKLPSIEIQKKFLENRKIFLWGEVSDKSAKDITEKLFYLELEAPGEPIQFYINTPGGSITAGMAIYDTMQLITSPITVIVTGMAASMGSILLCGAPKGSRFVYPHSRVMIHQPLIAGRMVGPAADIHIQAIEMERIRDELNSILANATGQSMDKIQKDTDRDFYMTAAQALDYGIADKIVDSFV